MALMSDQQRDEFLTEVRVAILAIDRATKGPLCAPVWYRYREGSFEIAMASDSAKAILLRRAGRASVIVQQETLPYQYVSAEGPVKVTVMSQEERHAFLLEVASRYLGPDQGARYADNFPDHDEALVTLTVENWRTEVLG